MISATSVYSIIFMKWLGQKGNGMLLIDVMWSMGINDHNLVFIDTIHKKVILNN